ncbi:uncharacterized protein LOC129607792 [Condylostylus longicornis]|uniref:uncharacterized protein LOC129607792 n=1 Tax=Condylostylus longicornis TaxID=2530218 RepID=UPI00244E0BE8|nr:uncharacterized protein LOC129607792 [Condylostylus longicornis]
MYDSRNLYISISSDTEDDSDIEVSSDSSCNDSTGISSGSSSSSSSDSETELVQKFSTNSVKGLVALIFEKRSLLTRPPSNVTRTGKMFGYGIYFADAVTKAAQYCNGRSSSPSGILILAEIALGTPYALTEGEKVSYLPNGTNCYKLAIQTR